MKCLNPIFKKITTSIRKKNQVFNINFREFLKRPQSFLEDDTTKYVELPCGKCVFCLQQKVNEWTLRIKHELMFFRTGMFLTLTYNNSSVPRAFTSQPKFVDNQIFYTDTTLVKAHLQKFFKRLRYYLDKEKRKIKYYACGEYGDKTDRAHYHVILLGMKSWSFHDRMLIKKCWSYGHIDFGDASVASGRYVAKYCNKVHESYDYKKRYLVQGREAPFKLSSLGFGKRYVEQEKDNIYNNLYIQNNKFQMSIPRTYYRWLCKMFSDFKDRIKEKTQQFRETHFFNLLKHYSSRLTQIQLEDIFNTIKRITQLNIVLKNNFQEEVNVYDLSNYPQLYELYHISLENKANELKEKEKQKISQKKFAIF